VQKKKVVWERRVRGTEKRTTGLLPRPRTRGTTSLPQRGENIRVLPESSKKRGRGKKRCRVKRHPGATKRREEEEKVIRKKPGTGGKRAAQKESKIPIEKTQEDERLIALVTPGSKVTWGRGMRREKKKNKKKPLHRGGGKKGRGKEES